MAYAFEQLIMPGDPVAATITATGGNLLVAAVHIFSGTGTITGITDDKGNTWTLIGRSGNASGLNEGVEMWYAYNVANGVTNITATRSGSDNGRIKIFEFSGFGASDPKLASNTSSVSSGNPAKTTLTGTLAGSLLLGLFSVDASPSPGAAFTQSNVSGSNWYQFGEYDLSGAGGTVDVDTAAGSVKWNGVACEFASAAGGSSIPVFQHYYAQRRR